MKWIWPGLGKFHSSKINIEKMIDSKYNFCIRSARVEQLVWQHNKSIKVICEPISTAMSIGSKVISQDLNNQTKESFSTP